MAAECRICDGPLELLHRGAATAPGAEQLSPTCHEPGAYGDLYRCRHCGSVIQPALPGGATLSALYRDMADDAYLAEEAGRRATANRLLDLVAPHVPKGRLLDVGCSHGLLLDEARRRGYEVEGLELSAGAVRHCRERLGLEVHATPLEEFDGGPFDVVVLADVIEHLDDPRGALDRCRDLVAPGGALLIVTPDPSSPTARLAGRRWWGFLPAHTCLIPRTTLRELIAGTALTISHDVPLVRTFSFGYWAAGLGERSGPLAAVAKAARALAGDRPVSLSLGDERVILAHRVETERAPEPIMTGRGRAHEVHAVLPAYNAAKTIPQVAEEMPVDAADRALLVDDRSSDDTAAVALAHGFDVVRHPANRGYGANQMTCYQRALLDGADVVVMVHADNQYDPGLVAEMVRPIEEGRADVVIGSRLLEDRAIIGGMPRWKWLGNRFLTEIENRAFRRRYSEYHTGYRAFSAEFLRSIAFLRNSDDFVFDQEIFAQAVARGARVVEVPIPTRYFLEASSVSFLDSVAYGLRTLRVLARFRLDERREDWLLLRPPAVELAPLEREAPEAAPAA